ncbi:MAG: phosphate regulon transcriptional regulatory protein PhoB [Candidatus Marinimicrobia bacterium]|jgi:two-component system phosphate regulon response regulator PhoB|nr:phosphate regulon transcriptional regulatory protein PhoB [Candidatus Neomarinimicrobiota bacterium]|tara:strand:- start:3926 stop:4615 length:690 start_codon:yes stop_codon:yes gene_type:complete
MTDKILVVEDEKPISELIGFHLEQQNYQIKFSYDGESAIQEIEHWLPDLILLDWMLPNISGIEVLKRIKRKDNLKKIPIIMLTAKGQEDDKIRGFELGVEDYVTKPFLPSEILARIKSLLKRTKAREENDSLKFHDININLTNRRVTRGERKLNLGPTEFNLLKFFIENKGRVYSRQQLLDNVWLNDAYVEPRTVDVHIRRLRKELNLTGEKDFIRTVRSAGYSIDSEN